MPTNPLPPASTIPSLSSAEKTALLDTLFEPHPALHAVLLPLLVSDSHPSYPALIASIHDHLESNYLRSPLSLDRALLDSILSSHPRLGEKKVDSEQSQAEQANLRQDGPEVEAELRQLNEEYEGTFNGFRYVVFVNGRGREEVMADMRMRIERAEAQTEREVALQAICDIADDRAKKLSQPS